LNTFSIATTEGRTSQFGLWLALVEKSILEHFCKHWHYIWLGYKLLMIMFY